MLGFLRSYVCLPPSKRKASCTRAARGFFLVCPACPCPAMPGVPARRPMRLRAGADVPVVLELFDLVGAHPVRLLGGLNAFRHDLEFHQLAQGHDQLGQRALVVRARDDGLVDPAGSGWGLPRPGWLRRTPARCDPVPWWCTWSGRRCAAGSRCRGRPAGPG